MRIRARSVLPDVCQGAIGVVAARISVRLVLLPRHQAHSDHGWSRTRCTVIERQPHQMRRDRATAAPHAPRSHAAAVRCGTATSRDRPLNPDRPLRGRLGQRRGRIGRHRTWLSDGWGIAMLALIGLVGDTRPP
jgi:hypothetical protein